MTIEIEDLDFSYGEARALKGVSFGIARNEVSAFIGPSACGKSTLLRCFNPNTKIFTRPDKQRTEDYITGRFG